MDSWIYGQPCTLSFLPVGDQKKLVVPAHDRGYATVRDALNFLFVEMFEEPAWADCARLSLINEDQKYDSRGIKQLATRIDMLPQFKERS